ncbi:MAG: hypothetical protein GVY36_07090, partial [Verrucomicrobia bacterium]|nr:hypothetical protein [Verrucomicrobiota bacterium]
MSKKTSSRNAPRHTLYHGVCTEARAPMVQALAQKATGGFSVVLVANPRRALELAAEVETYATWADAANSAEILHFPENPPPDIDSQRRADRNCERLATLSALLQPTAGAPRILLATPEALLGDCPEKSAFVRQRLELNVGEEHPFSQLVETLTHTLNYDSEALCEQPGQIATRGGLIDIYPYDATCPYRVDFFGDEIESIRTFDPTSQRTESSVDSIQIAGAADTEAVESFEGALLDYLPEASLQWILEDAAYLVREHPYRFEEKAPAPPLGCRTFHQAIEYRSHADTFAGICELDTDASLFRGAKRIEIKTEPVNHYRFHTGQTRIGYDHFESEQSARFKFEAQLAEWAKEGLEIAFATTSQAEANRIEELLADNPAAERLKPHFFEGTISGG